MLANHASLCQYGGDKKGHAKQRILARDGTVTDAVSARFRCTGGNAAADKPAYVIFNLNATGPSLAATAAPATVGLGGGGAAVGGGGEYPHEAMQRSDLN